MSLKHCMNTNSRMQIVAPQKEVQEEKVQKEIKSGKYG